MPSGVLETVTAMIITITPAARASHSLCVGHPERCFQKFKNVFITAALRCRHYSSHLTEAEIEVLKGKRLIPDHMGSGRAWMQIEVHVTLSHVLLVPIDQTGGNSVFGNFRSVSFQRSIALLP